MLEGRCRRVIIALPTCALPWGYVAGERTCPLTRDEQHRRRKVDRAYHPGEVYSARYLVGRTESFVQGAKNTCSISHAPDSAEVEPIVRREACGTRAGQPTRTRQPNYRWLRQQDGQCPTETGGEPFRLRMTRPVLWRCVMGLRHSDRGLVWLASLACGEPGDHAGRMAAEIGSGRRPVPSQPSAEAQSTPTSRSDCRSLATGPSGTVRRSRIVMAWPRWHGMPRSVRAPRPRIRRAKNAAPCQNTRVEACPVSARQCSLLTRGLLVMAPPTIGHGVFQVLGPGDNVSEWSTRIVVTRADSTAWLPTDNSVADSLVPVASDYPALP